MTRRWQYSVSIIVLTTSCSQNDLMVSNCAKLTSELTVPQSDIADFSASYEAKHALGGYFMAYHLPSPLAENVADKNLEVSYCAMAAQQNLLDINRFNIWTAGHCSDLSRVVKIDIIGYDNTKKNASGVGTYRFIDGFKQKFEDLNDGRSRIAKIASTPELKALGEELLTDGYGLEQSRGDNWCKEFTAKHYKAGMQQVCSSMDDLSMNEFSFPDKELRTEDDELIIKALRKTVGMENIGNDDEYPLSTLPGSVQTTLINWQSSYRELSALRYYKTYAKILEKIKSCNDPSKPRNSYCINQDLAKLGAKKLLESYIDTSEINSVEYYDNRMLEQKKLIKNLWQSVIKGTQEQVIDRLLMGGNFSFSKSAPVSYGKLQIPLLTAYMQIPQVFGVSNTSLQHTSIDIGDEGFLISRPESEVNVSYKFGDSGTLFLARLGDGAVVPLGTISTVNGEATSGGLSTRIVPGGEGSGEINPVNSSGEVVLVPTPNANPPKRGKGC